MTGITKKFFEGIEIQVGPDDSRKLIDILKKYPHFIFAPINEYEGFWIFYSSEMEEWTRKDENAGYIQESRRNSLTINCTQLAYAILYQYISEARMKGWIE